MIDENARRRNGFRPGVAVRLADGRRWIFPTPGGRRDVDEDRDLRAILEAIREAEDPTELLRAELILAIHLLKRNYELGPEDYRELLGFEPGEAALAEAQRAIHDIALAYNRLEEAPEASPAAEFRRGRRDGPDRPTSRAVNRLLRWCLSVFPPRVPADPIGAHRD